MRYFENQLRLRQTPAEQPYLLHQRLDYHIQERLQYRAPYSWHGRPYPGSASDSLVTVRTAATLGLPGEQAVEMQLSAGQSWMFRLHLCHPMRKTQNGYRSERKIGEGVLPSVLASCLEKNGLVLRSFSHIDTYDRQIIKAKESRGFWLQAHYLSVIADVACPAKAEEAFTYGLGKKRVFGFGMLTDLEML